MDGGPWAPLARKRKHDDDWGPSLSGLWRLGVEATDEESHHNRSGERQRRWIETKGGGGAWRPQIPASGVPDDTTDGFQGQCDIGSPPGVREEYNAS